MKSFFKHFWLEIIGTVSILILIGAKLIFGERVEMLPILALLVSVCAFLRAYKSDSATDSSKKFAQYKELTLELEKEQVKQSLEKWKNASEVYFVGNGEYRGIIEEAFSFANMSDQNEEKIKIVDEYLSSEIIEHQRNDFSIYEPIFKFVYKVHKCWDNNMLSIDHVRDLFQKEELTALLEFGIYFVRLGENGKEASYYEPSFRKIAKLLNCEIWQTRKHLD